MPRTRVDDATAHADHLFAHASFALAIAVAAVSLTVPSMRGTLTGAVIVGTLAALRLVFHPLRLTVLSRVYVDGRRVLVASPFGRAHEVDVIAVRHEKHSPWPVVLELDGGGTIAFVARRDDGSMAFFDLDLSDRARYDRPSDARDSIRSVEKAARGSRHPRREPA